MNTASATVDILPYAPEHQAAFRDLNHEWITRYFVLEDLDRRMLDDPQGYILDRGGYIFMARYQGQLVGTCALIFEHEGVYELAKMAVTPSAQGLGIGWLLGRAAIEKAREIGAREVELLSNRKLAPALQLYRKLGFAEAPLPASEYQRADIRMVLALS
ncbi:GNAT family N-acetyltransferase [Hymenobacter oligotrophus]|uniref:GNAT family N-acetyltransferase n=1 Tax=Hymenobacter oligotrophus TaxID=2319843 RepID=A0A3B7R1R6_9BACT|nr:GNAT family N-acetyltransferase [Hymenobacter oligotrophus]AYA37935.1 GNAT family N-acetyltransferase [Hymenobacter oligotrophus]